MGKVLTRLGAVVVVAGVLVGCSNGGGKPEEPKGAAAAEVCGGFAKSGPVLAALTAVVGDGGLTDDRSQPDETLKVLKNPDGKLTTHELANGSPFCMLRTAEDGESALDITFREALVVPGSRDRATFRYFVTGREALSSDRYAKILFTCRTVDSAEDRIVSAELERMNKSAASEKDLPVHQMTVLNAAARTVATRLGCADAKLVDGVPAEERS